MKIEQMKSLINQAISDIEGAGNLYGEALTVNASEILAQIAIAKALTVIAAVMVENKEQADFAIEREERLKERGY